MSGTRGLAAAATAAADVIAGQGCRRGVRPQAQPRRRRRAIRPTRRGSGAPVANLPGKGGLIKGGAGIQQLDWIRADLDTGAKLFVPRLFDPSIDTHRLVTEAMLYRLRAFRHDDGSAAWDIGVCVEIKLRTNALKLASDIDHVIGQSVAVAKLPTEAQQLRARLGPDVLDWSLFAGA
jgi:hypothetical protein